MAGLEKIQAMLIDPDPKRRERLRIAASAIPIFRKIERQSGLAFAARELDSHSEVALTVFFISSLIDQSEIAEFIRLAKSSRRGVDSAYILTLSTAHQDTKHVTTGILQGIDSFLYEPFSVDNVSEVSLLARVLYRNRKREREEKVIELLVSTLLADLDEVAYNLFNAREPGPAVRRLRENSPANLNLEETMLTFYYKVLESTCQKGVAHRPQLRSEEIEAKAKARLEKRLRDRGIDEGRVATDVETRAQDERRIIRKR